MFMDEVKRCRMSKQYGNLVLIILAILAGTVVFAFSRPQEAVLAGGGMISASDAQKLLEQDATAVILDVRTADEFASGHIPGAKLLPYDEIDANRAAMLIPAKDAPVVLYCRSGRRSAIAADSLRRLGYTTVYDLGGVGNWHYGLER